MSTPAKIFILSALPLLTFACANKSEDGATAGGGQALNAGSEVTHDVQDPAVGTPERKAFMAAVHTKFDPMLHGQEVRYLVSYLKTEGGFTFMQAQLQVTSGGNIDWKNTDFADAVANGFMDLMQDKNGVQHIWFSAIATKNGIDFSNVELDVAPTDVSFAGQGNPAVPKDIFPISLPE
jgi:hypothetical protein